jgi:hypothetical protein
MKKFFEWQIKSAINNDSEILFKEDFIGLKSVGGTTEKLPGQKVYKVIDTDEQENTVTLTDDEGKRYKFDQDELSAALAENSTMKGFQIMQYPIGYVMAGSATELPFLSIYDSRLKGKKLGAGPMMKMKNG